MTTMGHAFSNAGMGPNRHQRRAMAAMQRDRLAQRTQRAVQAILGTAYVEPTPMPTDSQAKKFQSDAHREVIEQAAKPYIPKPKPEDSGFGTAMTSLMDRFDRRRNRNHLLGK